MTSSVDYNALLLKVMAHDLLAPLTAIKWQTELLDKHVKDNDKRARYLKGIADSTELGIMLTKNVHVAAQVLGGSYQGVTGEGNLAEVIKESITALRLQYERHGLKLDTEIEILEGNEDLDEALLGLFVWAVGKFFLTCTPPETTVRTRGMATEEKKYVFSVSAPNVKEREALEKLFSETEGHNDLDQTFVFVKLLKDIAPMLTAKLSIEQDDEFFAVTIIFEK